MKSAIFSLVFASAISVAHATACSPDNCARAVTGTSLKVASTSRRADCSSFFQVTVTPDTFTSVIWETVTPFTVTPATNTETIIISTKTEYNVVTTITTFANQPIKRAEGDLNRRAITVSPSAVPLYASACTGTSRYSSACSCWGVTHVTIEAATPTVFVTSTASATATITATATVSDTTTVVLPSTSVVVGICNGPFNAVCSGQCKPVGSDPDNCGSCGNVCASGTCVNGVCAATSDACPSTHNCAGGNLFPECSGRPGYPSNPGCLCFMGYDGSRFCTDFLSRTCSTIPLCNTHDDCGYAEVCVVNGCCNGGGKICRPVGNPICREPSSPARLFRQRRRADDGVPQSMEDGLTELGFVSEA